MNIDGKPYRTIWVAGDGHTIEIIDQTKLPHRFETASLRTLEDAARAILTMQVRGAPLIGATAAYGVCLALKDDSSDAALKNAITHLAKQRPTAINLKWALEEMRTYLAPLPESDRTHCRVQTGGQNLRRGCRELPAHWCQWARDHQIDRCKERRQGERVNMC